MTEVTIYNVMKCSQGRVLYCTVDPLCLLSLHYSVHHTIVPVQYVHHTTATTTTTTTILTTILTTTRSAFTAAGDNSTKIPPPPPQPPYKQQVPPTSHPIPIPTTPSAATKPPSGNYFLPYSTTYHTTAPSLAPSINPLTSHRLTSRPVPTANATKPNQREGKSARQIPK